MFIKVIFTFFYINRRNIGFVQIFDFRFLMDLHFFGWPDHDLTISGKCLCFCLDVCLCVCDKNFVLTLARQLMYKNFMKIYILNYTTINWCLSTFEENRSASGAEIKLFQEFSGHAYLDFY